MQNIILQLRYELTGVFADVMKWFDADAEVVIYRPRNSGWTIEQILEHIYLTNHYLLILIKKGTAKAIGLANKQSGWIIPENYQLDWNKLKAISQPDAFYWDRPEHMEPKGETTGNRLIDLLNGQLADCLDSLDKLSNGEGVLYRTMMSVNGIGKIDVYHYILFLAQHARRHVVQMQQIKMEFDAVKN